MANNVKANEDVNKQKVNIILKRIIMAEKSNLHTKLKSDSAMIAELKKIIEEEVNAYK